MVAYFKAGKGNGQFLVTAASMNHGSSIGTQSDAASQQFVLSANGIVSADFVNAASGGNSAVITVDTDKQYLIARPGY